MIQKMMAAAAHHAADTCSELAGLGVLFPKMFSTGRGAMKLMGQPPVIHKAIPFQKNNVPSVVMNDGIRVRNVIRPLSNPIRAATPSTVRTESAAGTAAFKRMPSTMAEKVKFEPTDRSNSPDTIRTPSPIVIVPDSAGTVRLPPNVAPIRNARFRQVIAL